MTAPRLCENCGKPARGKRSLCAPCYAWERRNGEARPRWKWVPEICDRCDAVYRGGDGWIDGRCAKCIASPHRTIRNRKLRCECGKRAICYDSDVPLCRLCECED